MPYSIALAVRLAPSVEGFVMLQMKLEWDIHSSLEHPNIIQAYLGMEFETSVGLFMEYAGDSDAFSYMSAKQRIALREQDAKQLIMDVLQALHYLHEQVRS